MDIEKDLSVFLKKNKTLSSSNRLDELQKFLTDEREKLQCFITNELTRYFNTLFEWKNDDYELTFLEVNDKICDQFVLKLQSKSHWYKIEWTGFKNGDSRILVTRAQHSQYHFSVDWENKEIRPTYRTSFFWNGPRDLLFHLAELLAEHGPFIHDYAWDLRYVPILENRQKVITLLCIYKFRHSNLSVFPKDLIRLISEMVLKY